MHIEDREATAVEPRAYRDAIGLFASGVTVITTRLGDLVHGMTANAVTSVSLEPTLLLVCVDRRAHLHDLLMRANHFAVNILAADQQELANHFAGRDRGAPAPRTLRFVDSDMPTAGNVPTIAGCLTALRCAVETRYAGGDHTIVLGRVLDVVSGAADTAPLIWFAGGYRQLRDAGRG